MGDEWFRNVRFPAVYARVSSDEQVEGTSLDYQREACVNQGRVYGWTIPEERIYIDDGYSGASLERPAMARLRADVRAGRVDCVMVLKLDRLSRSLFDTVSLVLDEWSDKCVFRSITENFSTADPIGRLLFSILASFAAFELENIRFRTQSGKLKRFEQGRRAVGKPPIGYDYGDVPGTMVVNNESAELVRRVFRLYLEGYGTMKIASILNGEGARTSAGREWTSKTVNDVLRNPVYTGQVKFGGRTVPGLHEAIIDNQVFAAVQALKRNRAIVGGKTASAPWLLAGIVRCAKCGSFMYTQPATRSRRTHADGSTYYTTNKAYYLCGGRLQKGIGFCTCGHISKDDLEEKVVNRIKSEYGQRDASKIVHRMERDIENQIRSLAANIHALDAEIGKKRAALARWETAFEAGTLSAERFGERVRQIERDIVELNERRFTASAMLAEAQKRKVNAVWIQRVAHTFDRWDALPLEAKRRLVSTLVASITVWKPSDGRGKHQASSPTELEIVYKAPSEDMVVGETPAVVGVLQ